MIFSAFSKTQNHQFWQNFGENNEENPCWICILINQSMQWSIKKRKKKNPILSATARIHHYIVLGGKGNWVNLERRQPATITIYVDR